MARGTTLIRILDKLRAEARLSQHPAHNQQVRDSHVNMLGRIQERLWRDFTWPHLRVERQMPIQMGQRLYDFPADLDMDRTEKLEVFRDGRWVELCYGIGQEQYASHNSDLDERSSPARNWRFAEAEDFELWPISDVDADETTREDFLKFTGIRKLRSFVADDDRADLDDDMLALYGAAELLASRGEQDAQVKLQSANNLYARLRGGMSPTKSFQMFGIGHRYGARPRKLFVSRYERPV